MVDDLIQRYRDEYREEHDKEPNITPRILAKFKQAACRLKIELSAAEEAIFNVEYPDFYLEGYTREEFLRVCEPVFARMFKPIDRVFEKANLSKDAVTRIIMVGGTTFIPFVRQKISEYFNNRIRLDCNTNPQEIVALGAAYLAF